MHEGFWKNAQTLDSLDPAQLAIPAAHGTCLALRSNKSFHLIELRRISHEGGTAEALIVECENDGVPSRNEFGIQYREPLALLFFQDRLRTPEVRALRPDFPTMSTPHQNHVLQGEPASLCLYFEPWAEVVRSWTPEKHLSRILWWLSSSAMNTLHRPDQPPEQLYFKSKYRMVLPHDLSQNATSQDLCLFVEPRQERDNQLGPVLVGHFLPTAAVGRQNPQGMSVLTVLVEPVLHGRVERFPATLGELDAQLRARGAGLAEKLFAQTARLAEHDGIADRKDSATLLVLLVPIKRTEDSEPERVESKAFCIGAGLGALGCAGGVLYLQSGKYWRYAVVGGGGPEADAWKQIPVEPLDWVGEFTKDMARNANGINSGELHGILAGVGALGSALYLNWVRQGWGRWGLIDPDHVLPHNLARHIAIEPHVGRFKVEALKDFERKIYGPSEVHEEAIAEDACRMEIPAVAGALGGADLVVDATTSLQFPRDVSRSRNIKRAASAFLTPSGLGSVLMLEDSGRSCRLDALESQYYRAIIREPWGLRHLQGHKGHLWVGGGCRDISAVIPNAFVQIHAGILSHQLRLLSELPDPAIHIWQLDSETSAIQAAIVHPREVLTVELASFSLIWDADLQNTVHRLRKERLPNETGGVLLGYIDLALKSVFVVDALAAPPDSIGETNGFIRGTEGLREQVAHIQQRTAFVVGYIGEWHSHPRGSSVDPSIADIYLLGDLARQLNADGLPAFMLIVGDEREQWLLGTKIG